MIINIHATVSSFSVPFYEYMRENYSSMATKHAISFYCYCLDNESYNSVSNTSTPIRVPDGSGTTGHCNAVRVALSNFEKTDPDSIDIIADTDTAMLVKGWDETTVDILKNVGVFGSSYERIGGRCSGSGKVQTYKDKPSFTWFAASKKYSFSAMDVTPEKGSNLQISNPELSALYNLPVGYELLRDTGWQIPSYLNNNQIPFKILVQEKPTDNAKVLKTGDNYHEEYQLDGFPFMAHQRGSLSKAYRKHELSQKFYDCLDEYFKNMV